MLLEPEGGSVLTLTGLCSLADVSQEWSLALLRPNQLSDFVELHAPLHVVCKGHHSTTGTLQWVVLNIALESTSWNFSSPNSFKNLYLIHYVYTDCCTYVSLHDSFGIFSIYAVMVHKINMMFLAVLGSSHLADPILYNRPILLVQHFF